MARKLRINEIAYYHIVSRGNIKADVFLDKEDFDKFLFLLLDLKNKFKIIIHAFCLMSNHYHILLQTREKNISKAIKHLNYNYAIYFNYKYNKVGHLWQARFFSSLLYDETHVLNVAKYIERNPFVAGIVEEISAYTYQSYYFLKTNFYFSKLINESIILNMTLEEYESFIYSDFKEEVHSLIYDSPKVIKVNDEIKALYKRLESFFPKDKIKNREIPILNAYTYGYSKIEISKYLNISSKRISQIISKLVSGTKMGNK